MEIIQGDSVVMIIGERTIIPVSGMMITGAGEITMEDSGETLITKALKEIMTALEIMVKEEKKMEDSEGITEASDKKQKILRQAITTVVITEVLEEA